MKLNLFLLAAIGSVLLSVLYWITGLAIEFPQGHVYSIWSLTANFLISLVLGIYIINTGSSIIKKSIYVFLIYFIIGHFNLLIEAYIFNITDRSHTLGDLFRGLLISILFSPLLVLLFNRFAQSNPSQKTNLRPRSIMGWSWRILAGDFLYLVLYVGAGLILSVSSPEIMEFYEGKIPPFKLIIETQLYLRGFLFMAVALLILHTMRIDLVKKALFIGLVFSILGAIAPLLPASDLMPNYVRWGHGIEVSISNFIFGLLLGYLFGQSEVKEGSDSLATA